ncbi:beta-galactosidase GalA [Sphingomonas sp. RIT328]|uniref:beta-galactosidase GalA n=1 Tax=Sphingomonas sp. RIT328 TaxID=1470591 RepID=UPI000A8AB8B6|nr:beta-galactosidase GalA [Sphingomonas sp. RIT328]
MVPGRSKREQLLFDRGWQFALGHGSDPARDFGFGFGQAGFSKTGDFDFAQVGFDVKGWRSLDLPHDWAVELPFVRDEQGSGDNQLRSHGFKPLGRRYPETSVGWYRREFEIPAHDRGRRIWIEFDGAFRDAIVFVNGCFIGRHGDGYTSFRFDLTDFLRYGASNAIAVRVDASYGDGWFYEGAGIYRHVWLLKTDAVHLTRWDSVVRTTLSHDAAELALSASVENHSQQPVAARLRWIVRDGSGTTVATASTPVRSVAPGAQCAFQAATVIRNPELWAPGHPALYTATVRVEDDTAILDDEVVTFGVRTTRFTADKGFFLNDRPLKIQGMCNHQDHAGVGVALPDRLQAFRLEVMQRMGCNAIRSAHNMPTPELVEACDRMGLMLVPEARWMSASQEGLAQLETMVRRYRNAPSVILWSIGNEENTLQGKSAVLGAQIAQTMVTSCHALDPTRMVTAAVNADNETGPSAAVDVIGFNYHREFPDAFHARHPGRPVIATEDASDVATRGEYAFDKNRNVVSNFDGKEPWDKSPEHWWQFYAGRDWAAGGFAWTGFDYRGEPSPFGWPSVSSNFGVVDLCGFPKDYFHYYRAWWNASPALHLFPHWTWPGREGEQMPVWVYSNLDEIELVLNGTSLGIKRVPHLGHVAWSVAYEPGVIEARGRRGGKTIMVERRVTTGPARSLRLTCDRSSISADGEDVTVITAECLDHRGRHIDIAQDVIHFRVSGAGTLLGTGNGDPNSHNSGKQSDQALFNGLAQAIVQSNGARGSIVVEASTPGAILPARLGVRTVPARLRPQL